MKRQMTTSLPGSSEHPRVYPSVAEARPDIAAQIKQLSRLSTNERLLVQVFGYRLRDVKSFLGQLFDGAVDGSSPLNNIIFRIFHVDPDYLENLSLPRNLSADEEQAFRERMFDHATILRSNLRDLARYAGSEKFKDLGLTCETVAYRSFPTLCVYLIGNRTAFVGAFNWQPETGDIGGPPRYPCFRIEHDQPPYSRMISWLENRANLLINWSG